MAKETQPETKGGGLRGPPKRWTGGGPRPARHIPWPELFKHHLSVLTGHLKMMDMVRKHCVEGTGNYETAKACVDRTHQMMRMFKEVANNFVPPKDNVDRVPLGASSASMYPGYSPADHIYGEAAQEYGERSAELKRKGLDLKLDPNGPQYVVGQSKKPRRMREEAEEGDSNLLGSVSSTNANNDEGQDEAGEPMEGVEQFFVIDSKPTPMTELGDIQKHKNKANDKVKRRVSFKEEQEIEPSNSNGSEEKPKKKKAKLDAVESSFAAVVKSALQEEEDIAAEVEARLKAKEEKRRRKEKKKRRRDSEDSVNSAPENAFTIAADGVNESSLAQKDKKEMISQIEAADAAQPPPSVSDKKQSKTDKKRRKSVADAEKQETIVSAEGECEKPKKKRKKDTASSSA